MLKDEYIWCNICVMDFKSGRVNEKPGVDISLLVLKRIKEV